MKRKSIDSKDETLEQLRAAERVKAKMENDGWAHVQTIRLGLYSWRDIWSKAE